MVRLKMYGGRVGGAVATRRISRSSKVSAQKRSNAALVKAVKKARVGAKQKIKNIVDREKAVSKGIRKVQEQITAAALRPSPKISKTLSRQVNQKLSRANNNEAKAVIGEMKALDAHTQIFHQRAALASDINLATNERVKLLNQMEDSLYQQEHWLKKLKRSIASPKGLIAIGLVGLAAYGLYRAPNILEAFAPAAEKLGEAAQKAGEAAQKTNNSAATFVKAIVCLTVVGGATYANPYLAIPAGYFGAKLGLCE